MPGAADRFVGTDTVADVAPGEQIIEHRLQLLTRRVSRLLGLLERGVHAVRHTDRGEYGRPGARSIEFPDKFRQHGTALVAVTATESAEHRRRRTLIVVVERIAARNGRVPAERHLLQLSDSGHPDAGVGQHLNLQHDLLSLDRALVQPIRQPGERTRIG